MAPFDCYISDASLYISDQVSFSAYIPIRFNFLINGRLVKSILSDTNTRFQKVNFYYPGYGSSRNVLAQEESLIEVVLLNQHSSSAQKLNIKRH